MEKPKQIVADFKKNPYLGRLLVFSYLKTYRNMPPEKDILAVYSIALTHILTDLGVKIPHMTETRKAVRKALKGKRILELGCRDGAFLSFLRDHGAIVAGSTGGKYYGEARKMLPGAPLFKGNADKAGDDEALRRFSPNIVITLNYFDKARWPVPKPKLYRDFFNSLRRVSLPHTQIYIHDSVDNGSVLGAHHVYQYGSRKFEEFDPMSIGPIPIYWNTHTFKFKFGEK